MAILGQTPIALPKSARRRLAVGLWLKVLLCLAASDAGRVAAVETPSEYQIKAAFLLNFTKYVDWPPSAFANAKSSIVIAILGKNKFADDLEKMVTGRVVNERTLAIKYIDSDAEIDTSCQILFIPLAEEKRLPQILEKLRNTSVLIVGESDDFLDKGGMIALAKRNNKIQVEINLVPARAAGLTISSRLLNVAAVVKGRDGKS